MRPRTFILLIAVLLIGALAVVLIIANMDNGIGFLAGLTGGQTAPEATPSETGPVSETVQEEPDPTPTPSPGYKNVVVTKVDIPLGTLITRDLVEIEKRPDTNIALQRAVPITIEDPDEVVGKIARYDIARGQEILRDMLAIYATDMGELGSDLSLFVDPSEVAVAFPINQLTGAAFAMRPGDRVDVLMTLRVVAIDPEFRTALPNFVQRVIEPELRENGQFLVDDITPQGRLEFIEAVGQVAEIVPSGIYLEGQDFEAGSPIPKRVTQLTIQQAEVLWVGTWKSQDELVEAEVDPETAAAVTTQSTAETPSLSSQTNQTCTSVFTGAQVPCSIFFRRAVTPDVVILAMSSQDALALKYALERGINIDLALRSQGDQSNFVTASVSLPQIVEQGGLSVPPPADFDLHPRPEDVPVPYLSPNPPEE